MSTKSETAENVPAPLHDRCSAAVNPEIRQQLQFVEWLKSHGMYSGYESTLVMQKMHAVWKLVRHDVVEVAKTHQYKNPEDRNSYCQYNEGWSDACDAIESRLEPVVQA